MMLVASSASPTFGKELTQSFSAISLLFLSEVIGAVFVVLSFGLMPLLRELGKLNTHEHWMLITTSVIAGILAPFLFFYGLGQTSAVNSALFTRAEMLFLIVLSAMLLREKLTRYHVSAIVVISLGICCVALKGFTVGIEFKAGDIFVLLSALAYALNGIVVKRYLHHMHPEMIILARAIAASWLFFTIEPFLTINLGDEIRNMSMAALGTLLAYGFIVKFLGVYGFFQAIDNLKVSTVSLSGTLTVVGGILFAGFYLGESIYWYHGVGGALIILGVVLSHHVGLKQNKKLHEHHVIHHHRNQI